MTVVGRSIDIEERWRGVGIIRVFVLDDERVTSRREIVLIRESVGEHARTHELRRRGQPNGRRRSKIVDSSSPGRDRAMMRRL